MNHDQRLQNAAMRINARLAAQCKLEIGKQFTHPSGQLVQIVDGQYLSNGRVSNFWSWKPVLEDGTLGNIEHGYGWL